MIDSSGILKKIGCSSGGRSFLLPPPLRVANYGCCQEETPDSTGKRRLIRI